MSTTARVAELPACNFCSHPTTKDKKPARFDFKTTHGGQWAFACPPHYREWRFYPRLGTGQGQLLLLEGEDEAEVRLEVAGLMQV